MALQGCDYGALVRRNDDDVYHNDLLFHFFLSFHHGDDGVMNGDKMNVRVHNDDEDRE